MFCITGYLGNTLCRFKNWLLCPVIDSGFVSTSWKPVPPLPHPLLGVHSSLVEIPFLAPTSSKHFHQAVSLNYTAHTRWEILLHRHLQNFRLSATLVSHINQQPNHKVADLNMSAWKYKSLLEAFCTLRALHLLSWSDNILYLYARLLTNTGSHNKFSAVSSGILLHTIYPECHGI